MKKIEFKDLYVKPEVVGCVGCIFEDAQLPDCGEILQILTGEDCASGDIVFKRKPKYEVCTEDNTKVGDTIQYAFVIDGYRKYRVEYLYRFENKAVVSHNSTGREKVVNLKDCKVEVR